MTDCYSCQQESQLDTVTDCERVWVATHWRVAHAIGCALPGWLVAVPRRRTTTIAELNGVEAAELGANYGCELRAAMADALSG